MLTVSPLPSEALAGYEENPTVKLFDCREQGAGSLKTIRGDVSSRAGRGSMGEQQQQQQLRDAMRTFGVVCFYGPTQPRPNTLTSLQTCRETGEEILGLLCRYSVDTL